MKECFIDARDIVDFDLVLHNDADVEEYTNEHQNYSPQNRKSPIDILQHVQELKVDTHDIVYPGEFHLFLKNVTDQVVE